MTYPRSTPLPDAVRALVAELGDRPKTLNRRLRPLGYKQCNACRNVWPLRWFSPKGDTFHSTCRQCRAEGR